LRGDRAPQLAEDQRFGRTQRLAARPDLLREIESHLRTATRAEWLGRFEQHGIPAGPIQDIAEAFASPLATERHMRIEIEHPAAGPISQVGAPWKLDGQSSPIRRPPPVLGEHTTEVMREWLGDRRD
jgi:crotonobetainyl-CoA:carnitine CoA-transferase CaiB-like acyl-CoA transferase